MKNSKKISKAKILVVDDDQDFCTALEDIFAREDYEITICSDGQKAMEVVKKASFDVAVLDLRMPVVSGHEILQFIRREHPETAVIMVSAHAEDLVAETLKKEAHVFLHKPFAIEELKKLIEGALSLGKKEAVEKGTDESSILVVDSDKEVHDSFLKASMNLGWELKVVEDADAAIAVTKEKKFELIFLNVHLCSSRGLEVFNSLLKIRPQSKIILTVAYGHSAKMLVEEALQKGAHGCIYKPFSIKEVKEIINRVKSQS